MKNVFLNSYHSAVKCTYVHCFDFIECFTTTFLRAHSWLNWVERMFIAKTVALNKCPIILTKYVACLVSSTQCVFFSYQCPGLFYTETGISYLSLIL